MKNILAEASCPLSADQYWQIRSSFEIERDIALADKRELTFMDEKVEDDPKGGHIITRTIKCVILEDPVPPQLRRVVSGKLLDSVVTSRWNTIRHDYDNACTFDVLIPHFKDNVSITGAQWLIPQGENSCKVITRFSITCKVFGVGGIVESVVSNDIQKAYKEYPSKVTKFLNQPGYKEKPQQQPNVASQSSPGYKEKPQQQPDVASQSSPPSVVDGPMLMADLVVHDDDDVYVGCCESVRRCMLSDCKKGMKWRNPRRIHRIHGKKGVRVPDGIRPVPERADTDGRCAWIFPHKLFCCWVDISSTKPKRLSEDNVLKNECAELGIVD